LSEGLSQGLSNTIDIQTLKQRERERATREKTGESLLSSKLADQELRKREQDIQNIRKTHEQFSMWWGGMDAQQQAIAKSSDQYKELQKFFKSFKDITPGLISDDGSIVASDPKDVFSRKLTEQQAKAKLNLASGKFTKEDIALLKLSAGDKDRFAEALKEATSALTPTEAKDPRSFIQKFGDFFRGQKQPQPSQNSDALQQPAITQPQAPVLNPNADALRDPLGAYSR
jgi:hypothetical protein